MAITMYTRFRKKIHNFSFYEILTVRKKKSLKERKRYCAYCEKKFYMPTSVGGSCWLNVADRTHGFFCKESCAALWSVEQLTQALEKDDWKMKI
jgi:hypothetical protein